MKRLSAVLAAVAMCALPMVAAAGDFHAGASLICSDCHVAHYSQSHGYTAGPNTSVPLGPGGPFNALLRNEPNDLCLTCHNGGVSGVPDVFGQNTGTAMNRNAGGLNAAAGHLANDAGYNEIDGHTLWSTDAAPGGTFQATGEGLECINCHAQHGSATQYRNLLNRGIFTGKTMSYAIGTNDLTKSIFERSAATYDESNIDYNEPSTSASAYAAWCQSCHTDFHGASGGTQVGGISGGDAGVGIEWVRHPQADVNIGQNATHVSSLIQFNSHTNRVKVMDSQGLWNGTAGDNTVTPSCFSCHKSHGNMNAFGLIFMKGTGTVTEEGDGGVYKDMCRQCHIQGG